MGCAVLAVMFAGCDTDLGEVRDPVGDNPPLADWSDAAPPAEPPVDDEPPTITIDSTEELEDGLLQLTGTASDDRGVTAIRIGVGASGPYDVAPIGRGFAEWQTTVEVPAVGPVTLTATAFDGQGNTGIAEAALERPMPDDSTPPVVQISAPIDGSESNVGRIFVEGTASDDSAVARVTVGMELPGIAEVDLGIARTADFFGHWSLGVPLPPAATVTYVVRATDVAGNRTEARATVVSRAAPPHDPPRLVSSAPADGAVVDALRQTLTLTIEADAAIEAVHAGLLDGPLYPATANGDRYELTLWLRPGPNTLRVISRDADGLVGRDLVRLEADDGWGDITPVVLDAPGEPGGEVTLDLDKAGVTDMFPPNVKRSTTLMYLDPGPMVRNALGVIRGACGRNWEGPHFVNGAFLFDCPEDWGPAERNLWGLLTMTPANVNVAGTALEGASALALPILQIEFGEILAIALGIDFRDVMLGDDPLVAAIGEALIGSHPEAVNGTLPVTLEDGLLDMRPLGERFGPHPDGHPGFIAGRVEAAVLTDGFRMGLTLESNLRLYDGVDLVRQRKAYFADHDPNLPVVELEFLEIERFTLEGISDDPRVAMDFQMIEGDIAATPGKSLEPFGVGDSDVWDEAIWPRYLLEHVVALASRYAFGSLRTGCDLCSGLSEGAALFLNPNEGTDFAEIAIGHVGYDCVDANDPDCSNGIPPTPPGEAEHIDGIDHLFCREDDDCADPGHECHLQQRCIPVAQNDCQRHRDCDPGERCLLGECLPAAQVECIETPECPDGRACYLGECIEVPAGWFRLWMPPGVTILPDPGYMWDVVLEVAQARLRNSGVRAGPGENAPFIDAVPEGEGDALFRLQDVSVGLNAAQIEAQVRENLQNQRLTLADALLGAYTDPARPVDLFVDRMGQGAGARKWLMTRPCRVGRAHPSQPPDCDPVPEAGLYDSAMGGVRLDQVAPSGLSGLVLDDPANPPPPSVYYRTPAGTWRIDLVAVEADRVRVWLRGMRP